jgi:hypothetical protein
VNYAETNQQNNFYTPKNNSRINPIQSHLAKSIHHLQRNERDGITNGVHVNIPLNVPQFLIKLIFSHLTFKPFKKEPHLPTNPSNLPGCKSCREHWIKNNQ